MSLNQSDPERLQRFDEARYERVSQTPQTKLIPICFPLNHFAIQWLENYKGFLPSNTQKTTSAMHIN